MNGLDAGTRLWWVRLPRFGARLSSTLGLALLDGHWVGAIRVLSVLATPTALAVGIAIGWRQPGFEVLPTESLGLLVLFVAVGTASGQLGLAMVGGLAFGQLVLSDTTWAYAGEDLSRASLVNGDAVDHLLRVVVPLLIAYGVLAVVLVKMPLGTKAVVRSLMPGDRSPLALRIGIALVAQVALTAAAVYLWALAAPVLLRPVWSWRDLEPTVEAIRPLQEDAATLARVGALAAALRLGIQALLVTVRSLAERVTAIEEELERPLNAPPLYDRLPRAVRGLVSGALITLLLSGLLAGWGEAAVVFVIVSGFELLRSGVIPFPWGAWGTLMDRIPVLLRFVVGLVVVYLAGQWFLPERIRDSATFRPQLLFLLLGLSVFLVLIPTVPGNPARDREPAS